MVYMYTKKEKQVTSKLSISREILTSEVLNPRRVTEEPYKPTLISEGKINNSIHSFCIFWTDQLKMN